MSEPQKPGEKPLGQAHTSLHYAALDDDRDQVSVLLGEGLPVSAEDHEGNTPLHLAAQEYALKAAAVLISSGATVDARNAWGNTPLFIATFNSSGRGAMIELLLDAGADPESVNNHGQTPRGLAGLMANYDVEQFFPERPDA